MNQKQSEKVAGAFGYMTLREIEFMKSLVSQYPQWSTVVNIGAGAGTSGLVLAEVLPEAMRYTVDVSAGGPYGGLEGERNAFEGTHLPLPNQILGDSHAVGREWTSMIDILFIDADHSYDGIAGDIDAWLPRVIVGGLVLFHDYGSPNWPDVKIAVEEKMKDHKFLGFVESLAAYEVQREEKRK